MNFILTTTYFTLILSDGELVLSLYKEWWHLYDIYTNISSFSCNSLSTNYLWFTSSTGYCNYPVFKAPNLCFIVNSLNLGDFYSNSDITSIIGLRPNLFYSKFNFHTPLILCLLVVCYNTVISTIYKSLLSIVDCYNSLRNSLGCNSKKLNKYTRYNKFDFFNNIPYYYRNVTVNVNVNPRRRVLLTDQQRNDPTITSIIRLRNLLYENTRVTPQLLGRNVNNLSSLLTYYNVTIHASGIQFAVGERGLTLEHPSNMSPEQVEEIRSQIVVFDNNIRNSYDRFLENINTLTSYDEQLIRLGVNLQGFNLSLVISQIEALMLQFSDLIILDEDF